MTYRRFKFILAWFAGFVAFVCACHFVTNVMVGLARSAR